MNPDRPATPTRARRVARDFVKAAVVLAACYLAGRIGLAIPFTSGNVSDLTHLLAAHPADAGREPRPLDGLHSQKVVCFADTRCGTPCCRDFAQWPRRRCRGSTGPLHGAKGWSLQSRRRWKCVAALAGDAVPETLARALQWRVLM
jgi:hypothetical protein